MRLLTSLLALGLLGPAAHAAQTGHDVKKGKKTWTFEVAWKDAASAKHTASYALPASLVKQDLAEPLKFKKGEAARSCAKATVSGDTVNISASGKSRSAIKQALADAGEVRDQAMDRYLANHGYTRIDGAILPDHTRHVVEYADDLSPLVDALGGATDDPRDFANVALGFVQSIPYEQRARVSDRYRRPLSLLGRNKGDCDSKTVLFLALMHEAHPDLPLAVVYRPGHAYAALGLEKQRGDMRFREDGQSWIGVEPVGPALREVGDVRGKSRRRAKLGWIDLAVVE